MKDVLALRWHFFRCRLSRTEIRYAADRGL